MSPENDPSYKYDDFKADCLRCESLIRQNPDLQDDYCWQRDNRIIKPYPDVLDDAKEIFKINGKADLFSVIGNDELEKRRFIFKIQHKRNPKIMIDDYLFTFIGIEGFLAFFQQNGRWTLKSFHKPAYTLGDVSKSPQFLSTMKALGMSKNFKIGGSNG